LAALAVSHWIERQTGWSIKKFVHTVRRYRTVQIRAGKQTLTAVDPVPDDLREILAKVGDLPCALNWPESGPPYVFPKLPEHPFERNPPAYLPQ
jgi:hypothetical protein